MKAATAGSREDVTMTGAVPERIMGRIRRGDPGECWPWTGPVEVSGYPRAWLKGGNVSVYRIVYEAVHGPINGMTVDHVCHNSDPGCSGGPECLHRRCCNPDHLEAVTGRANVLRSPNTEAHKNRAKTHCPRGHEYTEGNVYTDRSGRRTCVECNRRASREYQRRKRVSS